jgi:hypothetical protein
MSSVEVPQARLGARRHTDPQGRDCPVRHRRVARRAQRGRGEAHDPERVTAKAS